MGNECSTAMSSHMQLNEAVEAVQECRGRFKLNRNIRYAFMLLLSVLNCHASFEGFCGVSLPRFGVFVVRDPSTGVVVL